MRVLAGWCRGGAGTCSEVCDSRQCVGLLYIGLKTEATTQMTGKEKELGYNYQESSTETLSERMCHPARRVRLTLWSARIRVYLFSGCVGFLLRWRPAVRASTGIRMVRSSRGWPRLFSLC